MNIYFIYINTYVNKKYNIKYHSKNKKYFRILYLNI